MDDFSIAKSSTFFKQGQPFLSFFSLPPFNLYFISKSVTQKKRYERCWTFVSLISIWTTLNAMECDSSVDFFFLSRRCLRPESRGKFDSFLIMFCSSFNQVIKDNLSLNGLWHFLSIKSFESNAKVKLNLKDHFEHGMCF